jgi:hypothetical protein
MLDLLQWPALILSIAGAWCVGGSTSPQRLLGFWLFLLSNIAWASWGCGAGAWAVVISQLVFTITSVRGIRSNA